MNKDLLLTTAYKTYYKAANVNCYLTMLISWSIINSLES